MLRVRIYSVTSFYHLDWNTTYKAYRSRALVWAGITRKLTAARNALDASCLVKICSVQGLWGKVLFVVLLDYVFSVHITQQVITYAAYGIYYTSQVGLLMSGNRMADDCQDSVWHTVHRL